MNDSSNFILALKNGDINAIRQIRKSDLHNHFVLGGNREYIKQRTGFDIFPIKQPLHSMDEMHVWANENIGNRFDSRKMRQLLIESTFIQAKQDGVSILEIGEDVWGLGAYFNNDIDELITTFQKANASIAPDIELRLQIGLSRHCCIDYLLACLKPFWGRKEFYSIDLYGNEFARPIETFIPIYQKAKENGLKLKAHIGEWGTAEDVVKGIKLLSLDEVQHGIAAATSDKAINYLLEHKIRLNITPSSNVLLGRVANIKEHPIAKLYRAGVDITINSDDILIFDSDVSNEYLLLYNNNVLNAEELDGIRINGLRRL
ncbi:adenosine deaminase [Clostridium sp.]|jgi:adenosine deaminase|uniref:adenosine deaminase n=1 Tax=Clostridium sp. TaxID=1506 RepID=UPI00258AABCF|nr:adenosine deaminase [Clostridium sp.]MDF2503037.1 add2 [Clostridium sp.]